MKSPEFPDNESDRLAALRALNILDTDQEERFDRLTRLAKRIFDVPMVSLSLIDADRQWFKSSLGMNLQETSREISFCGHTILGDEILIVSDARLDERFHDNPMVVEEPHIRFYAGASLSASDGSKLGTLCLLDTVPRTFEVEEQRLLLDLTQLAQQELIAVQLATTDDLTLLWNRRGFRGLAQHTLGLCKRLNKPAWLMYFDLNLFKEINDDYGHSEGDNVLKSFGALLRSTFRKTDVLGRLGGDEFAALLSDADAVASETLSTRLDQSLEAFNRKISQGYQLNYSVGKIEFNPSRHQSIDDLIKEADGLMYVDKLRYRSR